MIKIGSIVTRSDGLEFFIDGGIRPRTISSKVRSLDSDTRIVDHLLGRSIGESYYKGNVGNYFIKDINNSFVNDIVKEIELRKAEDAERLREVAEAEAAEKYRQQQMARQKQEIEDKIKNYLFSNLKECADKIFSEQKLINLGEYQKIELDIKKEMFELEKKPLIEGFLRQYNFIGAKELVFGLDYVDNDWYGDQLQFYRKKQFNELKAPIEELLQQYNFVEAKELVFGLEYVDNDWYDDRLQFYRKRQFDELKASIEELLQQYNFVDAKELVFGLDYADNDWYGDRLQFYKKKEFDELKAPIEELLQQYNFAGADEISNVLDESDYETLKAQYVKEWFKWHVKESGKTYFIDDQQTLAVLNNNKNTIVTARAGSGKTRTLVAKIIYLFAKYNIESQELLIFVFNKKASKEINERLEKITVDGKQIFYNPEIATTFHAFARKIVYSMCNENEKHGNILVDDKVRFIQVIIKEIPKSKIYQFFRNESFQIKKEKFHNEKEYFDALRNSRYETLDGKIVKSKAEKIICDYLFEHDIKYYYETEYYLNSAYSICKESDESELDILKNKFGSESVKPDFYLPEYDIPWEHWAISGNEDSSQIIEINGCGVIGDYDTYKAKMLWKKWFYLRNWIDDNKQPDKYALQIKKMKPLIETIKDGGSRADFETKLEQILQDRGIKKPKLPEKELIEKVWESQVKRFSKMITQFIDRAQQQFFDEEATLAQKIQSANGDTRTKAFLEIGLECYCKYHDYLTGKLPKQNLITKIFRNSKEEILDFSRYGIDFNLLLKRAIDIISNGQNEDVNNLIRQKRHILIDEYQDFSKLFLQMILSIRNVCPTSKLIVVGDDWQAINRFAGSDTEYFEKFANYFAEDNCKLNLTTNYRCDRKVVENARVFMQKSLSEYGEFSANSGHNGEVAIIDPKETFINYQGNEDDVYKKAMSVSDMRNPSKTAVQYLKTVAEIINKNKEKQKILILHRNNDTSFWFIDLQSFYERLRSAMIQKRVLTKEEFEEKIEILTMHRAKGLEADVVIILEADDGIIPVNHQDTQLFKIFGETEETALNDQKKLFYVAITRAKEKLYILHNTQQPDGKNGFIKFLKT